MLFTSRTLKVLVALIRSSRYCTTECHAVMMHSHSRQNLFRTVFCIADKKNGMEGNDYDIKTHAAPLWEEYAVIQVSARGRHPWDSEKTSGGSSKTCLLEGTQDGSVTGSV